MRTFTSHQPSPILVTATINCDRCGRDIAFPTGDPTPNLFGVSFEMSFGYGSTHDLETWKFDLCDDCVDVFRTDFVKTGRFGEHSVWET